MRVIVTGGSGMIGRALAPVLIKAGHELIILSRNPDKVSDPPAGAQLVRWDAKTAENWGHLINGDTAIINLAGANLAGDGFLPTRWTEERRRLIRQSRLLSGQAVMAAIAAAPEKPAVLLQSSAIGYYGTDTGDKALVETDPPGDEFQAQLCVDWEASTAAAAGLGVRHVDLRTGIVLSTQEGALPRLLLPFKLFVGGPFGNGQQWWSWIHLDDEVKAIQFLLETETCHGAFNLTAPNPLRNKAFSRILGKVMGRPSLIPVPAFAMRAAFGEVAVVVVEGQKVVPDRLAKAGFEFSYPELEPALRDLISRGA
ncbi:MAG: TIGR01777 family oxidoreductase [Anaerolineales bacterium]|nr:TIGR01777 family oxidoreductase [Anaerolineales bacterium]MCB0008330.1 TIGR01777 family oxidoreductase [Anaerolineales bacterium]MCB0013953.1 TIGR01777 family oxidoreductase [Anaerolineales bacterium]MCB0018718.1 TIGR01777 family oxidoreductase [Anaerolineales bacterium]MCB0029128.1 TIGR01777 family oxidoreductase [Anaerolineales bacterium]